MDKQAWINRVGHIVWAAAAILPIALGGVHWWTGMLSGFAVIAGHEVYQGLRRKTWDNNWDVAVDLLDGIVAGAILGALL